MSRKKRRMVYLLILILILLGAVGLWLNPEWIIARLRDTSPEVLYSVDITDPIIALTIDDGPDAVTTPQILDILEKYKVKVTFFLISEHIPGNEALVSRMDAEGHELGNHMTRNQPSIRLPIESFEDDLLQADEVISRFGPVTWFRPGSGWYNQEMLTAASTHGYHCALGSVYPFDPQIGSAWYSRNYVLWKVKPGDIIVLHDYQARGVRTIKVLESLLPDLISRGYTFVTLSELSELGRSRKAD
jgi:peptidoglycan/xylan/chitin deacetylase (PgdA/CDA1 family)